MHTMEILDPSGHLTLSWEPDDPASVERAREEFTRLQGLGFAFFSTQAPDAVKVVRLKARALKQAGSLDVRPVLTKTFEPRARRTVAVRPMQGG